MSTNVFDTTAYPDLANVRDRTADVADVDRLFFGEGDFTQATDVNEAFSRESSARRSVGDMVARDGDIQTGCAIIIDQDAGTVTISDGTIYLLGQPRPVQQVVLEDVAMTGQVGIGLFVTTTVITADDDSQFLGIVEGTEAYGEPGAVRTRLGLAWGVSGGDTEGEFYLVTTLQNGVEVAATAATTLSGVRAQIEIYDYDRSGNYVVRGMDVKAISLDGNDLSLSVGAGTADVLGAKITKRVDTPLSIDAAADIKSVTTEPHTYVDNDDGTATIRVNHPPIAAVDTVVITKERTVSLTKGAGNGSDLLPNASVYAIVSVSQGATTYDGTSFTLTADAVDWSLGGPEPTSGSSYSVTFQYFDATPVVSQAYDRVTVDGGVDGKPAFVSYDFKLPRQDRLILGADGTFTYLKGRPSATNPRPPVEPVSGLSLAVINHDWISVPSIEKKRRRRTVDEVNYAIDRLDDALLLIGLNRLQTLASGRNAGKTLGIFVDPFNDGSYRDAGETQDAATVSGSLQLAIDTTVIPVSLNAHATLNFSNDVSVEQALVTTCYKINEYQNFSPLPYKMTISPARDFWVEYQTNQLSTETQVFGSGNESRVTSVTTKTSVTTAPIATLRQIDIDFTIEGMGSGETLAALTFDGVDVTPVGVVANTSGVATGSFTIPAGRSAGTKDVRATTGSGRSAGATFEGQGTLQTTTLQNVVTVEQFWTVSNNWGFSGGENGNADPQAQSFYQVGDRHVSALALKFCAIGDRTKPVIVEVQTVTEDFLPSGTVLASTAIVMMSVQTGIWTSAFFELPPFQPADTMYAFVVKTDDGDHAIYGAELKKFDATRQEWVAAQPYTAGDRFSGSNGRTWLVDPSSDLTFRVLAPLFSPTTRSVTVGTFSVSEISDIQIAADIFLPTADCSVLFDVTVGSTIYSVPAGQTIELDEFFTGDIAVAAKLVGTAHVSPILKKDLQILTGAIRETGTYIGLNWAMGDTVDLQGSLSVKTPGDSSVTVYVDKSDDVFEEVPATSSVAIDDGFTQVFYGLSGFEAPDGGRIKIELTGGPGARPSVCDLNFSVGA